MPEPGPGRRERDRDPADLRGRGLRPGIHTGAARAGNGDSTSGRAIEEIPIVATRDSRTANCELRTGNANDSRCPQSERSAWMTSMREARDAGMREARTA